MVPHNFTIRKRERKLYPHAFNARWVHLEVNFELTYGWLFVAHGGGIILKHISSCIHLDA